MNYAEYIDEIAALTVEDPASDGFDTILSGGIAYAEQRCYYELDMLVEDVRDASASTTTLNRDFTLPTSLGVFQVITGINVITPASTAPDSGSRVPCTPVSRDVLDMIYPSTTGAGVPTMFNYFSQATGQASILFGPWPDDTYRVEVVGKIIPTPLSASNPTTFLTLYLPQLFVAASMIFWTGYQKNFGSQADDVKMAQSWSNQYETLKASAATFEARKRFAGASWTSKQLEPTAAPQRG